MNKKGFTLVELLAVIIILGIVLVIAVPKITSVIETSKINSLKESVKGIAKSAENEYLERIGTWTLDQENDPIECDDVARINSEDYENCSITFIDGIAYVTIYGKGKLDGYSCVNGTKTDPNCT